MNRLIRQLAAKNTLRSLRVSALLLLVGYITVFLFSPVVLHHVEHDHVDHQRDTCEKDPCHISIYHAGEEGGCDHKFHFTGSSEECAWCDVILAHQISTSNVIFSLPRINFHQQNIINHEGEVLRISISHADRGPPVSFLI